MEAATPLRQPNIRVAGNRLAIDGLVVEDECAARLVRDRQEAGEDPAATVGDAIEIGARVLDREQAAANAEYVKSEFERASRELEQSFGERAAKVAEQFEGKVDEVFGPDNGQLARELEKLFSDGSAASVQNRVRELVGELMTRSREDLVRQFSAADGRNPLADFKQGALEAITQAAARSDATNRALLQKVGELERRLQALLDEKEKLEEVDRERERGTAKGRSFEERVAEAIDAIAAAQGDVAEAVGDLKGASGKSGDVVVAIEASGGPARGRIVFEAKDRRLSRPKALEELGLALDVREADFAVLVVRRGDEVPARMQELREYNGDKLIVAYDPEGESPLALEVAYRLARARVLMARAPGGELDAAAVRESVERALQALDDVRKVKARLTGAKNTMDEVREIVDSIARAVRVQLEEVEALVAAAGADAAQPTLGL
jgi:hypothetical protein